MAVPFWGSKWGLAVLRLQLSVCGGVYFDVVRPFTDARQCEPVLSVNSWGGAVSLCDGCTEYLVPVTSNSPIVRVPRRG